MTLRLKLCILICLLLASSIGYGLTLKENIHVFGDGSVYARTNTAEAKDLASGSGYQIYKRVLILEDDASSLQSSYLYNKELSKGVNTTNKYLAMASADSGSQHTISIYSNSSIDSQSRIKRVGNSLSTEYNIKSSNGDVSEAVINSLGGHSRYIAEAELKGNFTISSRLSEKVDVSRGFDAADLLANLQSVDIKGSRGAEEDNTIEAPLILIGGKEASNQDTAAILTKRGKDLAISGNPDDLDKAIKLYDQALELDPENPVILNNKGAAFVREGKYEDALMAYDSALELDSEYSEAMVGKGSALNRLNRSAEAIGLFENAIRLDPGNAIAWNNKGVALTRLGGYDEAVASFDKAIEIDPGYEDAYFSRGKLFYSLQNYQEALKSLNRALELNPNDKEASRLKELVENALSY